MKPLSIWTANAQKELAEAPSLTMDQEGLNLTAKLTSDSLWVIHTWKDKSSLAFRTAFSPAGSLELVSNEATADGYLFTLECSTLDYRVLVRPIGDVADRFSYLVEFTPKTDLKMPYWPKDILSLRKDGQIRQNGTVHTQQVGTRSGILYFNDGDAGSVFYFQNLTALNPYCEDTQTSAAELVGGAWPEIGFSLPSATEPLKKGKTYTISHAFVDLRAEVPEIPAEIATQYLDRLAAIYVELPRPQRFYHNWLDTVERGIADLYYHKGCWTFAGGHMYLNAYVADYKTPPEVMVQLAVLMPMLDYLDWKGEHHKLVDVLLEGLPAFYEEDMGTIVRWLPAVEQNLDHSEEQKKPRVMDAWYLHHPMMNLARLATDRNNKMAEELLMNSVDYVMKVAQRFKYQWPVFYQMDTLKILKAETEPGKGGEKDVPGTYADLMYRVYKLTGEKKYLNEAVKAVKQLDGLTFDIFYQANNTAFSASAMLRLYKETKDKKYLELSYVMLAAIFNNVQLWECDYGHAKKFTTFFAVFPLKDAPYTAAYEEQEVYSALHNYLKEAEGIDILPSVRLLISEFIRHMVGRVAYYFPTMLPKEILVDKPKTGEIDTALWIALEDLQDGWQASGDVGQEVYGAGIAFGVIPRQYYKVPNEDFVIFCDYPTTQFKISKNQIKLQTDGDQRLECRIIILLPKGKSKHSFTVTNNTQGVELKAVKATKELIEFASTGGQDIRIKWKG